MRVCSKKKMVRLKSAMKKSRKKKKQELKELRKHKNYKVMLKTVLEKSERNARHSQKKFQSFNLKSVSWNKQLANAI